MRGLFIHYTKYFNRQVELYKLTLVVITNLYGSCYPWQPRSSYMQYYVTLQNDLSFSTVKDFVE